MRNTWLPIALALGMTVPMTATAAAKIGESAPAFSLTDTHGQLRSLADFAGKTVVLEWTNPGCPFVKKHYASGNIPDQQRAATGQDVVWLVINSSAPGKQGHLDGAGANKIQTEWKAAQTHYLLDPNGEVGKLYEAKTTPHMHVIDANGVLRYAGAIDSIASADTADLADATQYVPQVLSELAAGKPVSVSLTQPYGCSVKYKG